MLQTLRSQAWAHLFVELSRQEISWLASGSQHISLLASRRATMVLSRVRLIAALFAGLTPLWIVVDVLVLPFSVWSGLVAARLLATAGFAWVAMRFRNTTRIEDAHQALAAIVLVPVVFVVATHLWLGRFELSGLPATLSAGYGFLPFVLMVGLAIFPLTLLENLLCAAAILGTHLITAWLRWQHAELSQLAVEFWLLGLLGSVAVFAGMSQLAFMIALVREAIRDPLTGVFSRSSGEELLELQFIISTRAGTPLSIAFVDLDRFKEVNDQWGHDAGDRVLAVAAERIRATLRTGDMLARWGGEEFVLIMPNTQSSQARLAIHRVRVNGLGFRPDERPVTASIGVAERVEEGATDWHQLVEKADARMYEAKAAGRDQVVARDARASQRSATAS